MRPLTVLPLLLVAGCGSDPAYPPPTDAEARAAYARAIQADLIDSPPRHTAEGVSGPEPGDTPAEAGHKVGTILLTESERTARLDAPRLLASLDKVTVGNCSWGSIDPIDIKSHGRARVEGQVEDGYTCDYEVFHDTETRGPVSAKGTAYFFHRDGSYDFAGVEVESFAPVEGR